ncbi:MAG: ATP-binding cassette domain-containing protein [Lachnospiraceae bacterium]|jgi:molybdate transport system ATP-binding protein|nr:ATP-binding cassette domain-containing protein [Lachnospiraceae bacterium]MCH4031756.1 ATP-binding cassette domain-containing protein [Lachnospiraceae bacterium]MCH4071227.1 ATP-binding cassette domain-containing protein [Lachnospiraceae bacterium]MCH4108310.1 ATP-binding cassette domain-containing protein [Lachnospiraceae bacterium]MCI1302628.1 ATP-binding cassette domain-containing protein [Lachnospiraceae bacterium]
MRRSSEFRDQAASQVKTAQELEVSVHRKLSEFTLDVNFSGGGRIGILGASGCGKSMTLKSIAGIEKPDSGRIAIGGRVLYDSAKKINLKPQLRHVGYLFQNYALFPTMTVAQNIAAGVNGTKAEKAKRVADMIRRFHLSDLEDRYPRNLSGGQQQRVALARLMATEPDVILLDEPFSAMDAYLRDQLQEQLSELLADYAGTVILVSHNRDEVYRFCSRVLIMDRGRVIRDGEKEAVFRDPKVTAAARLTGCKNFTGLVRVDAHHAKLTDWGTVIETAGEIPEGTVCLGYRAHDFIPVWGEKAGNSFRTEFASEAQLPFEKNYYFRPQGEHQKDNPELICWFVQREMQEIIRERGLPDRLQMDENHMLFLTE